MIPLFSLTTRGLEAVAAEELSRLSEFRHISTSYRRVSGEWQGDAGMLLNLRCVDDLFIRLAEWHPVSHTRDMLAQFELLSSRLNAEAALNTCASVRAIPANPRFSISASFVGKRNYSTDEIKLACSKGFSQKTGWHYCADDRESDLNLRIFIEHDNAVVGIRLSKNPLHERDYKQHQVPGSLKPPVAAAMLAMLGLEPGALVVDPCCGAGTLLAEALASGARAYGGDIDPEAVTAARLNAGPTVTIEEWDARQLPLTDDSVNFIATNLPWDRQIQLQQESKDFYQQVCSELERVLVSGGRVAVLTSLPELLRFNSLKKISQTEISLFGQKPLIVIYQG